MSSASVVSRPPTACSVLRAQLPGADFVHACQATTRRDGRSALQAYRDMAATIPGWFDGLMALRNRGMRLLGMKHLGSLRAVQVVEDPQPGQRLGIFTLQSLDDDAIVLEDDDRHLRVQLALQWQGDLLEVATVVHTHNAFGRVYMLPVAPVHRLIVPHLLEKQVRLYR
ncbi:MULTISPECIES: DUF2867 domain-containing protein [Stenotrophomonas]|uniref:DUF2867 domain-containing protein n=1 Tax=unclassified Stenotrophomonas TaxID=196198 RepID=UPI0013114B64|nr:MULTISPECIES: DUF2867 domain-containing protein [unclassified Stenotrophomonas]ELF4100411.1 DUF2867 domain-containing protein [Stenotrophomonas maltophilia]MBA0429822.1 DUF2867 domain-containing protein [Stenotrophomonas maltophilia]MDH0275143.1 DUF2867 domain-containing protein [Stenotrophomonas sp. GD04089]MDH1913157.1 DUF2867 domain-containing protein [Stenotrophomonas sp. GD03794]WQI20297.1 DUF2867 domain-containing protein [Stenotrophomonas maltophilia]